MEKKRKWLLVAAFFTVLGLTLALLTQFTEIPSVTGGCTFEKAWVLAADGTRQPFDPQSAEPPALAAGGSYCYEATVTDFPADGYLRVYPENLEITLYADGKEFFHVRGDNGNGMTLGTSAEAAVPDAAQTGSFVLVMQLRPLNGAPVFCPPLCSVESASGSIAMNESIDNLKAIPAGAYAVLFLMVCGLFIMSLYLRQKDWSLLVLTLAALVLLLRQLASMSPELFLPARLAGVLSWKRLNLVAPVLLIVYLALGRRDRWRQLGRITLCSAAALAGVYLISKLQHGIFAGRVDSMLYTIVRYHFYDGFVNWIVLYLVAACSAISAYRLVQTVTDTVAENKSLALKNQHIMDNYRVVAQSFNDTAALRHDWKNQLITLNLLYQEGEIEKLGRRLHELGDEVDRLRLPVYSNCFIVNAILQNASYRAGRMGVRFQAEAPLPERLAVDDGDVCSLLINMLDNAFEAVDRLPANAGRFVEMTLKVNQGFLAVCCRNSFAGPVEFGTNGLPRTTKADAEGHGLGLKQMALIADKYASKLDIRCDDGVFVVQTALKLKTGSKKAPAAAGAAQSTEKDKGSGV